MGEHVHLPKSELRRRVLAARRARSPRADGRRVAGHLRAGARADRVPSGAPPGRLRGTARTRSTRRRSSSRGAGGRPAGLLSPRRRREPRVPGRPRRRPATRAHTASPSRPSGPAAARATPAASLFLVPGLAFDPQRRPARTGRRSLRPRAGRDIRAGSRSASRSTPTSSPTVPGDPWDQRVDAVVTERRLLWSAARPEAAVQGEPGMTTSPRSGSWWGSPWAPSSSCSLDRARRGRGRRRAGRGRRRRPPASSRRRARKRHAPQGGRAAGQGRAHPGQGGGGARGARAAPRARGHREARRAEGGDHRPQARGARGARRRAAQARGRPARSARGGHREPGAPRTIALVDAVRRKLEETAGLTRDEAKRTLVEQMIEEARDEAAKQIRQIESEAREEADRRAKKIVSIAIERLAGEFVAERTVSVVPLPERRHEGPHHRPRGAQHPRHRGRDRRRPDHRRHAGGGGHLVPQPDPPRAGAPRARAADLRRPHPSRADRGGGAQGRAGARGVDPRGRPEAVIELGVHGIHPELVQLVGMLKYRYSYAQNVLDALDRDRLHRRRDGGRARAQREAGAARRRCCTTSARR